MIWSEILFDPDGELFSDDNMFLGMQGADLKNVKSIHPKQNTSKTLVYNDDVQKLELFPSLHFIFTTNYVSRQLSKL